MQNLQAGEDPVSQLGRQDPEAQGQPRAGGALNSQVDPVVKDTVNVTVSPRRSTRETRKIYRLGY